jgi:hypothetical protein
MRILRCQTTITVTRYKQNSRTRALFFERNELHFQMTKFLIQHNIYKKFHLLVEIAQYCSEKERLKPIQEFFS